MATWMQSALHNIGRLEFLIHLINQEPDRVLKKVVNPIVVVMLSRQSVMRRWNANCCKWIRIWLAGRFSIGDG